MGWPSLRCSAQGLTPSFIHNPNGPALTECRVQSIARTSNGCLQKEESFNNDPEKSHSEVTVKPAQSGLAWPSTSWKRGSPPGNGVRMEGGRDTSQRRNVKQTLHSLWEAPVAQKRRRKQTDTTGSSEKGDCQGAVGDPAKPPPLGWGPLTFHHLSRTRLLVSCLSPNAAPYLSVG